MCLSRQSYSYNIVSIDNDVNYLYEYNQNSIEQLIKYFEIYGDRGRRGGVSNIQVSLKSLNVGKIEDLVLGGQEIRTAIRKQPVHSPIFLGRLGFDGDEQAFEQHGGLDKAVCLYSYDHYNHWNQIAHNMVDDALFGENLTVFGLTEEQAFIGDIYSFGETVIQITQPRNPCYKLAKKYNVPDMVLQVQKTGFTGFHFRVLNEGKVSVEDKLILLQSHPSRVNVALVNEVKFLDKKNIEKLNKVIEVDALAEDLKSILLERLSKL